MLLSLALGDLDVGLGLLAETHNSSFIPRHMPPEQDECVSVSYPPDAFQTFFEITSAAAPCPVRAVSGRLGTAVRGSYSQESTRRRTCASVQSCWSSG